MLFWLKNSIIYSRKEDFMLNKILNSKQIKYEPSRTLDSFYIAGFTHHDGLEVIDQLVLGADVELFIEPDNPYDSEAVAIYYGNKKLGYVPKDKNSWISLMLYYGHDIFEAKVQAAAKDVHPEQQIRVVLKLKDQRK